MTAHFIIGSGDIGRRVAELCRARGLAVGALARSDESAARLAEAGVAVVRGDLDRPESLAALPVGGAVVHYFAPPATRDEGDSRMGAFTARAPLPRKVVYISTTGVYGDRGGDRVDEDTPPAPVTDRARRRLDAEQTLRAWGRDRNVPVVVLRVAGIYGPGRWPLDRLRRGEPVVRAEECGYTNRIHADDLAAICLAAADRGAADRIYNVSDGQDSTMTAYFHAVADRFGIPRPPELTMAQAREQLSPMLLSYLGESRRLDNRRLLHELGVTLRYRSLAEGLAAAAVD